MRQYKILFVDDEEHILSALKRLFFADEKIEIHTAKGGLEGLQILARENIDIVVSDQKMPKMSGNEFLRIVKEQHPKTLRMILTGYTDINAVIDSINHGEIYRHLTKPWDDNDLKITIYKALDYLELKNQNQQMTKVIQTLKQQLDGQSAYHHILGKSKAMELVFQHIKTVASVDWTVLIHGETGSGKELVARAIHEASPRKNQPFVAINCAGLNDSLLSSQLFGHKKGSFTGAIQDHKGVFETAEGGTLFLDEIGDIPPNVQINLLRVLEQKEIIRLGESQPRKIDVRIVTATHRDLQEEVKKGNFREDLLYRIRIARIELPPLRERYEDIPLLCSHFLEKAAILANKNIHSFTHEAMKLLMEYPWPGNVRELKSAIEYGVIRAEKDALEPGDFPPEIQAPLRKMKSTYATPSNLAVDSGSEKEQILSALRKAHGNRTKAARMMGMSRATFYRRLENLGIDTE